MNRLGIDMQTAFGMPPLEHVRLAAELGCGHVSLALTPMPWNPCGFAPWSLRDDAALRRELIAALNHLGIVFAHGEGFGIKPGIEAQERASDLDLLATLGARRVSAVSMEPDQARALDQLAILAELCAARKLGLLLEFAPPHPINTLAGALTALRHVGHSNAQLLIDAMHFFRSGGTIAELTALDPPIIGHAQLCDVPLTGIPAGYMHEACFERLIPGEGELPLREFIAALPGSVALGLEVPMQTAASDGKDLHRVIRQAVEASRLLMQRVAA